MIERKFVQEKLKEFQIQEYIENALRKVGHSFTKLQKTPLGEKIIIYASRPGLVVGRKGENIRKLTEELKKRFGLENPQIEINEVENPDIDAKIIAERIASSLERYGTTNFKGIGHKMMENAINAGAIGIEILISGKIPSSRAKRWRFYKGYIKKCGDLAIEGVKTAYAQAQLKSGVVGIQVRVMPPDIKLPDDIKISKEPEETIEEKDLEKEENKSETKESKESNDKKNNGKEKGQSKNKEKSKKKKVKENGNNK